MKVTVSKAKKGLTEVGLTLLGLTAGKILMNFATGKLPDAAVPAIGLVGLAPHFMEGSSDKLTAFGNGITLAGVIDGFQKVKAKYPQIASIPYIDQVPALAGGFGAAPSMIQELPPVSSMYGVGGTEPLLLEASLVN